MNVKQLIEQLQTHPPETMVVLPGYEGGVNELQTLEMLGIKLNQNTEAYYGKHELTIGESADAQALYLTAA